MQPSDLFRPADSCARIAEDGRECGEPNAHYPGCGCREGLEHVILADGPPVCRLCIDAGMKLAHHTAMDDLLRRTSQLPPWHNQREGL